MTRSCLLLTSVAVLALLAAASSARAESLTIDSTVERVTAGGGGPFKVTGFDYDLYPLSSLISSVDGNDSHSFNTFCIEHNEYISLGGKYDYTIGAAAVNGGVGGGSPDPLGELTAKLYYAYWTGQLQGFEYNTGVGLSGGTYEHGRDGRDLQEAIWYLENEISSSAFTSGGEAQAYIDWITTKSWADLGQSWSGIGMVRVVNLMSGGTQMQSQLVVVVPLPTSAIMGFVLLAGLGIAKRVRSRRAAAVHSA